MHPIYFLFIALACIALASFAGYRLGLQTGNRAGTDSAAFNWKRSLNVCQEANKALRQKVDDLRVEHGMHLQRLAAQRAQQCQLSADDGIFLTMIGRALTNAATGWESRNAFDAANNARELAKHAFNLAARCPTSPARDVLGVNAVRDTPATAR